MKTEIWNCKGNEGTLCFFSSHQDSKLCIMSSVIPVVVTSQSVQRHVWWLGFFLFFFQKRVYQPQWTLCVVTPHSWWPVTPHPMLTSLTWRLPKRCWHWTQVHIVVSVLVLFQFHCPLMMVWKPSERLVCVPPSSFRSSLKIVIIISNDSNDRIERHKSGLF